MNPKKLVISDIHLGNHQQFSTLNSEGISSRLALQYVAITKAMYDAVKQGCKVLIINGDIFHIRGLVEVEAVNIFRNVLVLAQTLFDEIIINTGNHDITHENTAMFNSLNVFSDYRKVSVINSGSVIVREDLKSVFVGFTNKNENELINTIPKRCLNYDLYTHQSIIGIQYRNHVLTEGLEMKVLNKFKRVFNGHIHEPKRMKTIYNLGSLYPMDFGDVGERYYYIVSDGRVDAFQSKHPVFITVKDPKHIRKDENFYRIISDKKIDTGENVKLVINKKLTFDRGVDYSNSGSIIKSYCENIKHKEMSATGIKIFKEANK